MSTVLEFPTVGTEPAAEELATTDASGVGQTLWPRKQVLQHYRELDAAIQKDASESVCNLAALVQKLYEMQKLLSQRGASKEDRPEGLPTWTEYFASFKERYKLELSLRTAQRRFKDMNSLRETGMLPAPKPKPLTLSAHDRRRLIEAATVGNEIVTAWEKGGNIEEAVKEYKRIALDSEKPSDIVTASEIVQAEPQAAPGEEPVSSVVGITADDLHKFVLKIASRDLGYYGAKFAIYPQQHTTEICAIYGAVHELCERKFNEIGATIDPMLLQHAAVLQTVKCATKGFSKKPDAKAQAKTLRARHQVKVKPLALGHVECASKAFFETRQQPHEARAEGACFREEAASPAFVNTETA